MAYFFHLNFWEKIFSGKNATFLVENSVFMVKKVDMSCVRMFIVANMVLPFE